MPVIPIGVSGRFWAAACVHLGASPNKRIFIFLLSLYDSKPDIVNTNRQLITTPGTVKNMNYFLSSGEKTPRIKNTSQRRQAKKP